MKHSLLDCFVFGVIFPKTTLDKQFYMKIPTVPDVLILTKRKEYYIHFGTYHSPIMCAVFQRP